MILGILLSVALATVRTETLQVEGRQIAIAYDAQGDAVAVSRPFTKSEDMKLEAPREGSDVIAILSGDFDAVPLLANDKADVVVRDKDGLTAIWYGVEHRLAPITIKSERAFLAPLEIRPRPRAVTTIKAELRPLPSLNVNIEAKEDFGAMRVRVKEENGTATLAEREVGADRRVTFASLQPAIYRVELVLPEWTTTKHADLTGGADFDVTIAVDPIEVTGRITHGGKAAKAKIALRSGKNQPKAETDEDGRYSLRVWTPGRYQVEVTLADVAATDPHLDMLLVRDDTTFDVDLPSNRFLVHVIDDKTKKPIANARVTVKSARKAGSTMRTITTDDQGIATLPPVYAGELTVYASADDYFEAEPVKMMVTDASEEQRIAVPLHRAEQTALLTILLPNGAPAVGAEVIAVRDPVAATMPIWSARADPRGIVRVPASLSGAFIGVRHQEAASTIRVWTSDATWTLRARAKIEGAFIDGIHVGGLVEAFLAR